MEEGSGKMGWGRFALIRAGKEISAAERSATQKRCGQFSCSILQYNCRDDDDGQDRCVHYRQ